jgi:glyoxylase-like metal-dependent hydrolase (beta-lactamase superfamily II)
LGATIVSVSEPREVAAELEEVTSGVLHWRVHDDRIDFVSAAHAVVADEGTVLIDPLPLADDALRRLGEVRAIALTSGSHQRSAWRLRRELGAAVHAPALSQALEEEPDARYGDGDELPGGLKAVFTPGAGTTQHTFLLAQGPGIAFLPDLVARGPAGALFLPTEYMHDPDEARRSLEKLLDLPFDILCLGHGAPLSGGAHEAIRRALETGGGLS